MPMRLYLPISMVLMLAMLSGCALLGSRSLHEAASIVGEDGDRALREPMRPIRGGTRVLVFALDGVGHAAFLEAVRAGRMARTAELMGSETYDEGTFEHAYAASGVLSVLPSSTTAAWTSIFTGEPPGETGIPGNEWFDRENLKVHAPNPVSTDRRYQVLGGFNEDRLGELIRVPTVFELADVRSHVSLLHVYRGADMINIPEIEPFGTLFNAALADVFGSDSAKHRFYEKLDEVSIKSLDESLDRYGIADLQVVYFPGIDLFTHIASSPYEDQQRYLEKVTDPAIGKVLNMYEERGILEQTYVVFVSDHGMTDVLPEDANALWRGSDEQPPELLRKAGFRVRSRSLKSDDDDFQAVLALQGGMAFVYLADRSTCPEAGMRCDWSRPPRNEEDLLEAARIFDEANRTGAHIPHLKNTLDLILARTGAAPGADGPSFRVFDGGRLVSIGDYLDDHPRTDLLRLEKRINELATGPYGYMAGDILLLSRMRLDEPLQDRTYFGEPYYSWHGSANRSDSEVVSVLVHVRKAGSALRPMVHESLGPDPSQTDLKELILKLLRQ